MKKKIVAMIVCGALVLSLAACGSSNSSSEVIDESAGDVSEEIDEAEEAEAVTSEEETAEEEAAGEEPVESSVQLDWVQAIYTAFQESDLDTVFEIIEAYNFADQLTLYEEGGNETLDYYAVDENNVLVVYSYAGSFSGEGYELDSSEILVGAVGADEITGEETVDDILNLIPGEDSGIYAETITDIYNGETTLTRYALIGTMFYMNYGLDDAAVADLKDYTD